MRLASSLSTLVICFLPFFLRYSIRPFLYSLLASFSLPLREGHAERRWRLDACDAPRSAGHDRPADASSIRKPEQSPPCVHCAPQVAPGCVRSAQSEPASPALRVPHIGQARHAVSRRLALHGDGKRSPLRRSTWDFWPGPVLAVVPIRPPSLKLRRTFGNRPSETSFEGLSGQPRQSLRDRAPFFARVIVTRRSRSREPPRRGR